MRHQRHVWILRQGCKNTSYYSLFKRQPRVTRRMVADAKTHKQTLLYETPDPFLFNFCVYGTERYIGLKLALGQMVQMRWSWTTPPKE